MTLDKDKLIDDMLRASNKVACEEDYEIEYHCTEKMMEGALEALQDYMPNGLQWIIEKDVKVQGADGVTKTREQINKMQNNRRELWTELKSLGR